MIMVLIQFHTSFRKAELSGVVPFFCFAARRRCHLCPDLALLNLEIYILGYKLKRAQGGRFVRCDSI